MSKAKLACKCKSISDSVLGDGCDICNPEKAKDVAYERVAELEQQLAERCEMVTRLQDIYGGEQAKIHALEQQLSALREESAGRMRRIEKLIKLCYEYDIPMEKVLDTGLDK